MRNNMVGLDNTYEKKRNITLQKIDDGIMYLEKHGLPINISSVADEVGLSRQAMYAPYIQAHLKQYKYFSNELHQSKDDRINVEALVSEKEQLKKRNKELTAINRSLKEQVVILKAEAKKAEIEYQRLLGKYQQDVKPKLIYLK